MDKELFDEEFVGRLEHTGILKAVAISRNLEGFRDAKGSQASGTPLVPFSSYLFLFC